MKKNIMTDKEKIRNLILNMKKTAGKVYRRIRNLPVSGRLLGRIGYYGSLAALLVILGVASHTYQNREEAQPEAGIKDQPRTVSIVITPAPTALPTPAPTRETKQYAWPVRGEIIEEFNGEALVWSETLAQWQTHPAIDIAGMAGEAIKACGDGTIAEAYDDPLWGNVIVIDHGEGITSGYFGVSTLNLVKEGQTIKCGETISAIGESAPAESEMDAHLHFSFEINGEAMDFQAFMKEKGF